MEIAPSGSGVESPYLLTEPWSPLHIRAVESTESTTETPPVARTISNKTEALMYDSMEAPLMLRRFLGLEPLDSLSPVLNGLEPLGFLGTRSPVSSGAATPRPNSAASTHGGSPVVCEACGKEYKGDYRRGNLARHIRQKHGIDEQNFPCADPGCSKIFKRQDARLKHYRKEHPQLTMPPLQSRH